MRIFGRKELTPNEAKVKLEGFNNRVKRLKSNHYKLDRLKTADLNKLPSEFRNINSWCSTAAKSAKYASVINEAKNNLLEASKFLK